MDGKTKETNVFVRADIGHIQIDNMVDKSFPVIFGPQRLFKTAGKKDDDFAPFVQTQISKTDYKDGNLIFTKFDSIQMQIGEMNVYCDQEILTEVVNLSNIIIKMLNADQDEYADYRCNVTEKLMEIKEFARVCSDFDAKSPIIPEEVVVSGQKIFIEFLHLAALKLKITLRLEKKPIEPTSPTACIVFLYSFLATLSNISDAPIYFKELLLTNVYKSPTELTQRLKSNYINQAIWQFYKLLGSIDIIGNPVGLVDRLGSGVFEFFNEPRKGFLKGPKEFAKGIGKGFKSLVTGVVAGGFHSVSKLTGSLYSLAK